MGFVEDAQPMAKEIFGDVLDKLDKLDHKGHFDLLRQGGVPLATNDV